MVLYKNNVVMHFKVTCHKFFVLLSFTNFIPWPYCYLVLHCMCWITKWPSLYVLSNRIGFVQGPIQTGPCFVWIWTLNKQCYIQNNIYNTLLMFNNEFHWHANIKKNAIPALHNPNTMNETKIIMVTFSSLNCIL